MDLWVALAVAGACYVTKHWKNVDREKENSSEFTSGDPILVAPQSPTLSGYQIDKSCPFRRLARRLTSEDNFNKKVSTKDVGSMSSGHSENDLSRTIAEELSLSDGIAGNSGYLYNECWMIENRSKCDSKKDRSSLRSRRSNLRVMKPLTSLDSCLMAQLYNEHAEMDEFVLSCFPSPASSSVRPFIVTDGRRIIGREGSNLLNLQCRERTNRLHNKMSLAENEIVYGVPSLPYNISLEVPGRRSSKAKSLRGELSSFVASGNHLSSLAGSTNGALLFVLGVSVGLISSLLANKREVDKLNGLLKQTESLVQDLQDELEMKDSLTVKELHIEEFEFQDTNYESCDKRASHSFSSEQDMDGPVMNNGKNVLDQRGDEHLESMSKIEAELEAELQRLELNMNSSSLERRLSDLAESDPNFVLGISEGELRPDMFGAQAADQPYADQDGSGASTLHPPNYSVSHRELSLRLYEVIQTRLEERVKALETALEISERNVQVMESVPKVVMPDHSDSDSISSPIAIDRRNQMDQPVIINLSGEALDAYYEAYDELKKVNEYKEYDSKGRGEEKDGDLNIYQDLKSELNHYDGHYVSTDVNALARAESTLDWQISSGDLGCTGTESESDDEFEKLLIKQIVEKNKRNSFAILNVEKELFEDKYDQ